MSNQQLRLINFYFNQYKSLKYYFIRERSNILMSVEIGKEYISKFCGKFKVIDREGYRGTKLYYIVKFLKTGYITSARYDTIKTGNINDPYYPKILGVACLGESRDGTSLNMYMYDRWRNMINRCYDICNEYYYAYGGAGVTVCQRWLCYANYIEDIPNLPGYNDMINNPHIKYHLDKDILQQGIPSNQKVYSPETCMFVPAAENSYQVAIDHFNERGNNYFNVEKHYNAYNVKLQINGVIRRIGRYKDPIIAANAANHARRIYGLPILNINIPYVSPEEVNALNIRKVKKEMVKIINK